jgi:ferrous iron transport protein A
MVSLCGRLIVVRAFKARWRVSAETPVTRRRASAESPANGDILQLGRGGRGLRGVVTSIGGEGLDQSQARGGLERSELERRLLEIGFVEGAVVEILHEGAIGRDPIGVKLDDMRVALRRREADAVIIRVDDGKTFLQAAE